MMTPREINRDIRENENGHGPQVLGIDPDGEWYRIIKAKSVKGKTLGLCLATGKWFVLCDIGWAA
jgi:hypothetical protein